MIGLDQLFVFSALGGGALFIVQLVLLLVGGSTDASLNADMGGDFGHAASDVSFKVLSLQGITAFVMMFGIVGWAMRADSHAGPLISLAVATAAGAASTWVIGKIFATFHRFQSSGNFDIKKLEGASGEIYLTVGPNRPGKVNVTVGNRLLTLEAITEQNELLTTGTSIIVKRVISDTTVAVEKTNTVEKMDAVEKNKS